MVAPPNVAERRHSLVSGFFGSPVFSVRRRLADVRRACGGKQITNARRAGGGGGHKDPSPMPASEAKNGGNPITTAFGGVWRVLYSPPSPRNPHGSYVPGRFPFGGGCFSLIAAPDGGLLQPTTVRRRK